MTSNHPANKFVFSFIGLSNFLNVVGKDGVFRIEGGDILPADINPGEAIGSHLSLASRPSEIDFVSEAGIAGTVLRKSFLGEIVDYQIQVGGQTIRVQKGRRSSGPDVGDTCRLHLLRPFWYPAEDAI